MLNFVQFLIKSEIYIFRNIITYIYYNLSNYIIKIIIIIKSKSVIIISRNKKY